ncbi:cobalamin-binding protein [Marinospirillum sp.]|uniref:cobalamin-binding protein n=1 Tax=Marinospirillum sp. TaxID=2183934 RepID=UPI00384E8D58
MLLTWLKTLLLAWLLTFSTGSAAGIQVTDAAGRSIHLERPAERIISLAPHLTENLFTISAGDRLVGTVSYSDYPEAALDIPRVGSYNQLDLEGILAKRPDLILAWQSGNPASQLQRLEDLGLKIFYSEPRNFADISREFLALGQLTEKNRQAQVAADKLDNGIKSLIKSHADKSSLSVFYQIWEEPLMTINGEHLISEMLRTCQGRNIFAEAGSLTPRIDRESLLEADPQVILGGSQGESNPKWLKNWQAFSELQAVQAGNLFAVNSSLVTRPTLRSLAGTQAICKHLDKAREQLSEAAD